MDALKVAVRMRPISSKEESSGMTCMWSCTDQSVVQKQNATTFYFDHVFGPSSSSLLVYNHIMKDMVVKAMEGFHGTFITYGQSGSGKTYTTDALAQMAIENMYEYIENCPEREFLLRVSYIELYNERLSDLLSTEEKTLTIREDVTRTISIEGLAEEPIRSKEDAIAYLAKGNEKRRFAETKLNERSSRAHCIIRIVIESRERGDVENSSVFVSHLHLVDLAGSEKAGENVGDRFREGCSINKSLLALSLVIRKLSEGQSNTHVSYRDSKLTRILQNGLGGNSRTAIICTISPSSVEESLSTLRFAMNAKKVQNKPHLNEVVTEAAMLKKCRLEIARLNKRISELTETPKTPELEKSIEVEKCLELEKLRQQVEYLTNLPLVSSKEPQSSRGKEDRRRRETVCVPQMSRYNTFRPPKLLPMTPLKSVEERPPGPALSFQESTSIHHRLESPCASSACSCHDLSFTELEKTFMDKYTQATMSRLKAENKRLRLQLRKLAQNENDSSLLPPATPGHTEQFRDTANLTLLLEENQFLQRGDDSSEGSSKSPKDEEEEALDGSLLMNQSQPLMDISAMVLNQSLLLPKMSHVVMDRNGRGRQQQQRLFDSIEKEKEFLEQFEAMMNEKQALEQKVARLERELKAAASVNRVDEDIDVKSEFAALERMTDEMESKREEMERRAEDLRLQEERIEMKIDLLCEKEESLEDKLEVIEAKEREVSEREVDFLRMELELQKRKQDLEKIHDEWTNRENDDGSQAEETDQLQTVGLGHNRVEDDDLEITKQELKQQYDFLNRDKSERNSKMESEQARVEVDPDSLQDEIQRAKDQLEAERVALEQKAAELETQEIETSEFKQELEKEKAKVEQMALDLRQQYDSLNREKSEFDSKMECEQLRMEQLACELRQQHESLNRDQREVSMNLQSELERLTANPGGHAICGQDKGTEQEDIEGCRLGDNDNVEKSRSVWMMEEKRGLDEIATELEKERDELLKERNDLEEERRRFREKMEDFEAQTLWLHHQKETLEEEDAKVRDLMMDIEKQKDDIQKERLDLEQERREIEESLMKERKDIQSKNKRLEEEGEKIEVNPGNLQDEIQRTKEQLEAERVALEQKAVELKTREIETSEFKQELEKEKVKVKQMALDLRQQYDSLSREKTELDSKMECEQSRLEQLACELRQQHESLNRDQREASMNLQSELERLRANPGGHAICRQNDGTELENLEGSSLGDNDNVEKSQNVSMMEEKQSLGEIAAAELEKERDELLKERNDLEEERRRFREKMEDFEAQTHELHSQRERLEEEGAKVEANPDRLRDEIQHTKDELEAERVALEQKAAELETLEIETSEFKQELEKEKAKVEQMALDLRQQYDSLNREKSEFDSKVECEQSRLEQLACELRQQHESLNRDQREASMNLQSELERLRANSGGHAICRQNDGTERENLEGSKLGDSDDVEKSQSVSMMEEKRGLDEIAAELEKERDKLLKERADLEEERRRFREKMEDFEAQTLGLHHQKERLEEEDAKVRDLMMDIEKQKDDIQKERLDLEQERREIEESLMKERKDIQSKNKRLEEEGAKIEVNPGNLQDEIQRTKEQLEAERVALEQKAVELKTREIETSEFKQELEKEKAKVEQMALDLRQQYDSLNREKSEFDSKMECEQSRLEQLACELRQQHESLNRDQREASMNLQSELERLRANPGGHAICRQNDGTELENLEGSSLGDNDNVEKSQSVWMMEEKQSLGEIAAELEKERDELLKERNDLEEERRRFREKMEDFEAQTHELHSQRERLEEEDAKVRDLMTDIEKQKDDVRKGRLDLEQERREIEEGLMKERDDIQSKWREMEEEDTKVRDLMTDIGKQKDDVQKERLELEQERREIEESLMKERDDIQSKWREMEEEWKRVDAMREELDGRAHQPCNGETEVDNKQGKNEEGIVDDQLAAEARSRPEDLAKIQRLESLIEKGKKLLSQKARAIAEERERCNASAQRVAELEEKEMQAETQLQEHRSRIEELESEQKAQQSEKQQILSLKHQVASLEMKNRKLAKKDEENVIYHTMVIDKLREQLRHGAGAQDLGASYLDPCNSKCEDASEELVEELKQELKDLQAKYNDETKHYIGQIKRLERLNAQKEHELEAAKEETEQAKAKARPMESSMEPLQTESNSKDQTETLARKVFLLERENRRLEKKNSEDKVYHNMVVEKYKEKLREGQSLGESYLQPSSHSKSEFSSEVNDLRTELRRLKTDHKELQEKLAEAESQYKSMKDDHQQRRPLQNLQQEPMASSGGVVDYILMLNKDREIKKLRKLLERCECRVASENRRK